MKTRSSGILVPLFSMVSSRSWGVGEYPDLAEMAPWLQSAGQRFVQILPITECPDAETSPYSALTAMALDAIHISLPALEDFVALGGEAALGDDDRAMLRRLRSSRRVVHRDVRAVKGRWLREAHRRFSTDERARRTPRAASYEAFVEKNRAWLDDYALFRALRVRFDRAPWWEWPAPLARRDRAALDRARAELREEIAFRQYVQWVAAEQWAEARRRCGLRVFGDVPFMISADSPDVWARPDEFRFDATVGVPPDAFSETGQDWGLPPLRWDVMRRNDFEWIRQRARRTAELFDGFRLDHLVGLYRTYILPRDGSDPFFDPAVEADQIALGERIVSIYLETGAEVIAEDLGTVPDFVRASLRRLGVPGYKVLRWERRWSEPDQPYIDPARYDEVSVATSGTHDTETLAAWWASLPEKEKCQVLDLPTVRRFADGPPLDAIVRALLASGSRLVILPVQDVFGWTDRINVPARVDPDNWTWTMPWPVDRLLDVEEAAARGAVLARWTRDEGR